MDEVLMLRSGETEASYLGLHQMPSAHFTRRLEALAAAALPEPGLHHLRRAFTPESEVPAAFVARTPMDRNTTAKHNIALRFHEVAVLEKSPAFPRFDAIFVDEAQFFAKSWFEIVNAALQPGGHLFLAADPTQGFLRRRQSWIAAGIEVRGRTTRLSQAYRNTREILRFARGFYESRHAPDDDEADLNIPDDEMLASISEEGEAPVVMLLGMDHLLESERDSRLSEDERRDLRRDHTRMLYMGFTRAGQRLVLLRCGGPPPVSAAARRNQD